MKLQHDRRHNPHPFTWEIPVLTVALVALAAVLALHLGRAAALLFASGAWVMPPRSELFTAVPGLLGGDATAGLSTPDGSASAPTLWAWLAISELATGVLVVWVLRAIVVRWGPHRMRGVAAPQEVERLLGVSRLRKQAGVIRPDLYREDT